MSETGCFGLRLGNSFASIAISKEGKVDVIANEAGDFVTPAIFSMQDDESTVVGLAAKHQLVRNAGACVINSTMLLNPTPADEVEASKHFWCCGVEPAGESFKFRLRRDGVDKAVNVETVIMEILSNMNSIANHALKANEHKTVLSVPLSYKIKARQTLAKIATAAGFEVLQIISDPAAACMAYGCYGSETILVYRLGGVSKDITFVQADDGFYEIMGTHHETSGANNLDKLLVDYIAKEFYQKYKLDPNESRRTIAKLYQTAQNAKHVLSSMGSAHIFVESLMEGVDFSHNLSRARFENLLAGSIIAEITDPIEELCTKIGVSHVDKIILCGGGMRIPKFQSAVSAMFPNAELLNTLNPEEVIAIGCAKQASYLSKCWDIDFDHMDLEISSTPVDLLIKVDGKEVAAAKAGTLCPFDKLFTIDKKGDVDFKLIERNSEGEETEIGEISLDINENDELALSIDTYGIRVEKNIH